MDKDFLRISQNIKNEYKSLNASNDIDFKEINEVSLFEDGEEKIHEELFSKEGFIENLYENSPYGKTKFSKEELEKVYNELAKMSTEGGKISEKELKLLASMGAEGDKNIIDKSDIKSILTNLYKTENIEEVWKPKYADMMERLKNGEKLDDILGQQGMRDKCNVFHYYLEDGTLIIDSRNYFALKKGENGDIQIFKSNGFTEIYNHKFELVDIGIQAYNFEADTTELLKIIDEISGLTDHDWNKNNTTYEQIHQKEKVAYKKMELAGVDRKDSIETIKQKLKDFDAKNEAKVENKY